MYCSSSAANRTTTDIFETFRAMGRRAGAKQFQPARGPTPPVCRDRARAVRNLVRRHGRNARHDGLRWACRNRIFGFDSRHERRSSATPQRIDAWMKAGGRQRVAARARYCGPRATPDRCRRRTSREIPMYKRGAGDFKYYVWRELARPRVATRARDPGVRIEHPGGANRAR